MPIAGGRMTRLAVLGVLMLVGAACGGGGNAVDATLSDFKIQLGKTSVDSGAVKFDIKNDGPSAHEFVVFKTDLAEDQLPTKDENGVPVVDEEGSPDLDLVDEAEDIEPDSSTSLEVELDPGHYVIICNVPAHYSQGMHTTVTVS